MSQQGQQRFRRTLLFGVMVGVALVGIAYLGPYLVDTLTPARLATTQTFIEQIWWPATGLRLAVYVVLAFGVYPAWVRGHTRAPKAQQCALPPVGVDAWADQERRRLEARLQHLVRAEQRGFWVFLGFLISDLLLAQIPYGLLPGG